MGVGGCDRVKILKNEKEFMDMDNNMMIAEERGIGGGGRVCGEDR